MKTGWNKEYEQKYNKIFRKSLFLKLKEWIDLMLYKLFIK